MPHTNFQPLEPEKYYHIYNHANGNENLFISESNYFFFLQRYINYISPLADTFAYCLMPNHFHFAIRIKCRGEIEALDIFKVWVKEENNQGLTDEFSIRFISHQFSNLFNSYSKAFNKENNRCGSLFMPRFKRKVINEDLYLRELIRYIHFNPVHHDFVDNLLNWKFSSFKSFFSKRTSMLKRDEVIAWFDTVENFWAFHQRTIDEEIIREIEL